MYGDVACFKMLKGRFTSKSMHIFPLKCNAIYPSKWFWCERPSFGHVASRDVPLLLNIAGLHDTILSSFM